MTLFNIEALSNYKTLPEALLELESSQWHHTVREHSLRLHATSSNCRTQHVALPNHGVQPESLFSQGAQPATGPKTVDLKEHYGSTESNRLLENISSNSSRLYILLKYT